jgi:ABC-type nitrate/sulfonate/bicarbonate transport system ATPase subunit
VLPIGAARDARATGGGPVLEVRGLTVCFGDPRAPVRALDAVDLTAGPGELVAVLGPSGCGKSTLLRVLAGLAANARVRHDALRVPPRPGHGTAVAWMPQRDGLLPWRRALANATLGARIAGVDRRTAEQRARELLPTFGLAGFERAWPHELSGGMRQRLALLRTCLVGAPLLLLDEPFGALDPISRRRMNTWLAGLDLAHVPGERPTVVLVTHDVDEAVLLADRVVVLSARPGRVVLDVPVPPAGRDALRVRLLAALDAP